MSDIERKPPHLPLVVFASLLAAIAYLESALLEYPLPWLGAAASLAVFAVLLCAQGALSLLLYRHLRRSADAYSTFFSRATLLALAAYLALTVLFLVPHGVAFVHHDIGGVAQAAAGPPA